ncbi:PHP domain-containing protein [Angustibacter sp. Root456]|uniref:PHP domain-containing protein n=1 Tax=Angustibacter sp. Root456 TaxID=1736539 RepID=UPI0006FF8890|nr:PHP domain-containing protein [Angustibacter sp. Root456]KQX69855.1 metal-dependent phosphoesterase [Angustibacter sp. Root456]
MRTDLHTHSTVSDGTQSPAQVVAAAHEAGLDVVALTDHDSTAGWAQAADAARRLGVRFVPGMEISCGSDGVSVHLLSYLHDPSDDGLAVEVDAARDSRHHRAERIVELLARDVEVSWADVEEQVAEGATIGRPHIADALVARGVVRDREEAFAGLLSSRGPYYVRHYAPDPVHAVQLVVAAGGVPVMAHPMARRRGRVVADEVIEEMADAGLAGLEVYHRDHDRDEREHLLALARRLDLLVTGSSDYHGAGKPNRLGENTTDDDVLAEIERRATGTAVVG